jgi:hypothetical protein
MTIYASREDSSGIHLMLPLMPDEQEWIPGLLPRPDKIRFVRGALWGIALCLPMWVLAWWTVAGHF